MNTLKNVVKKAIAVGSGVVMLGATTAGALALDLGEYPAPFIKNGQFDGMIVVGEKAASSDIIGAIDLAASLQASATTPVTTTGSTKTVLTGDVKQISESSDMLEIGENLNDVTATLSDDDLQMLKSGTVRTQKGTTAFTQTIDLTPDGDTGAVVLAKDHDEKTGMFLKFDENKKIFTYQLSFTSGLESDLDGSTAKDFEDESIYMLGDWYTISKATRTAANTMKLELLSGQVSDTLTVGETKTYEVNGKEYEVTVLAIGNSDEVKFLVNGEATDTMNAGETSTLNDGTDIGVRDVIATTAYREKDPGSMVEFYLGADKISVTDDVSDSTGSTLKINDESVNDAKMALIGTVGAVDTDARLNEIDYTLTLDAAHRSDVYLADGEGLRTQLAEPAAMLGNWDIVYSGLSKPTSAEIRFEADGDDQYNLVFENQKGDSYTVPYAYVNGGDVTLGDDTNALHLVEPAGINIANASIAIDDYFVVSTSPNDRKADTYVLRFTDVNNDDKYITVEDLSSGQSIDANYAGVTNEGDIIIGGKKFHFAVNDTSGSEALAVDLNGDNGAGDTVKVTTHYGGVLSGLELADGADAVSDAWNVTLTTDKADLDEATADVANNITFTVTAADQMDAKMSATISADPNNYFAYEKVRNADSAVATNVYGTWFQVDEKADQANDVTITYPSEEVEALVYVVGGESKTGTSTTGGAGARVNPVGVGAAVLDKDVKYDQDNMIVVGGPCANTMAAQLLGNPADCTEGFTSGHAMIKLFDTGNNVALLIAGYDAADTVAASRVVAESADYKLSGTSVDVTTANLKDIKVTSGK